MILPPRKGEGFYSYPGCRDLWRIPLLYPYLILIVDPFETGNFEKYDPSTGIAEGKGELLISRITAFAERGKYWFFKDGQSRFSFYIPTKKIQKFASEKEFAIFLKERDLPPSVWKNPEIMKESRTGTTVPDTNIGNSIFDKIQHFIQLSKKNMQNSRKISQREFCRITVFLSAQNLYRKKTYRKIFHFEAEDLKKLFCYSPTVRSGFPSSLKKQKIY